VEFEELCRAYKELEVLLERQRKILLETHSQEKDAENLAIKVREYSGIGEHPIKDLDRFLRRQGIIIFQLELPEDIFSGFSWRHEEYGPAILINVKDSPGRRFFTLAHEYAHLLRSEDTIVCGPKLDHFEAVDADERFANRFAACFLMPAYELEKQFRQIVPKGLPDERQIRKLAYERYKVSVEALVWRLEGAELVPKGFAQEFISGRRRVPRPFYRRSAKPSWVRKFGEDYVNMALEAYRRGLISVGRLAYYLRISIKTALEEAELSQHP
jgi:Zn-dependent peptidase ImmA (M78 family)